jgi:hypothetical protein
LNPAESLPPLTHIEVRMPEINHMYDIVEADTGQVLVEDLPVALSARIWALEHDAEILEIEDARDESFASVLRVWEANPDPGVPPNLIVLVRR